MKDGVDEPGVVVFIKTDIEAEAEFKATISGFPSPFKSPVETVSGELPVVKSVFAVNVGVEAPGVVVFNSTEIEFTVFPTTTRSDLPSPFKSFTAIPKVRLLL